MRARSVNDQRPASREPFTLPIRPKHRQIKLPYVNYVGAFLGQKYQIASLRLNKEHLDIYSVTDFTTGEAFEAQAFELCRLSERLYSSRKRRMRRLQRSTNFEDDVSQEGLRFLISRPPTHGAEKITCCPKEEPTATCQDDNNITESQFPSLGPPSDYGDSGSTSPVDCNSGIETYAKVVSKALPRSEPPCHDQVESTVDGFPISRKGSRQRERRQRRREDRRRKATYVNTESPATP